MEDLSHLLTQLEHPDPARRERALAELRGCGEAALPLLRRALNVGMGATRPAAAEALVDWGDAAVPYLLDALRDPEREVRIWAVWCLKQIPGSLATPPLLEARTDTDSGVRRQAVDALAHREGSNVTAALCAALKDPLAEVRQRAAELLGERNDFSAATALCDALRDGSTGVRTAACTALGMLRADLGVPGLLERLEDPIIQVRKAAVGALGELRSGSAIRPLCKTLESLDVGLRETAAEALVQIGRLHSAAAALIGEVIFHADATRQELAGDILVRIGDASIPELCRLLTLTRASTRLVAARALRTLAARQPSPQLRAAIPVLKSELSPFALQSEPTRDELRLTLQVIEEATRDLRDLPIPTTAVASRSRDLPLPADEVAEPPSGAAEEAEQGGAGPVGKQFVRGIRRLWRGR